MTLPSSLDNPQGEGFHAELDDLYLRVAATPGNPARLTTVQASPPKVDTSVNAEDMTDDVGSVFSRNDFQGGDGLLLAHRLDGTAEDTTRYRTGTDIGVWREDPGDRSTLVTLAPSNSVLTSGLMGEASGATWQPQPVAMTSTDSTPAELLYTAPEPVGSIRIQSVVAQTASLWETTVVTDFPFGAGVKVNGLTSLNGDVYASSLLGVVNRNGGAWTPYSSDAVTGGIWAAKGRLLAAVGSSLVDVALDPSTSTVVVVGGGEWTGVADAGAFVVAANTDGYVYAMTYDPQELAWVIQAQTFMGDGNHALAVTAVYGQVLVATGVPTHRVDFEYAHGALWTAQMGDDGAIVDLQRVRVWEQDAPRALLAFADDVYVYVYPDVWRFDLINAALHRHLSLNDLVHAFNTTADRSVALAGVRVASAAPGEATRLFVLGSGIGGGTVVPSTLWGTGVQSYESVGRVRLPYADFATPSDKVWLEIVAEGTWINRDTGELTVFPSGLGPDGVIEVWVNASDGPETRSSPWLKAGELSIVNDMRGVFSLKGELDLDGGGTASLGQSRYVGLELVLNQNSGIYSSGNYLPALLSVSVRGVNSADEDLFRLPVNVSDWVERPNRRPFRLVDQGELLWQALKAKEGTQVALEMYRPATSVEGVLEVVDTPIIGFTPLGSATTVAVLTIRGKES